MNPWVENPDLNDVELFMYRKVRDEMRQGTKFLHTVRLKGIHDVLW